MRSIRKTYSHLIYLFLFTGLGGFSYLLLVRDIIMAKGRPSNISPLLMLVGCIFFFNVVGFVMLQVSRWLTMRSQSFIRKRYMLPLNYIGIALILFLVNYSLLGFVKMMLNIQAPFTVRSQGWVVLCVIWLVELVIVALVQVNQSYLYTLKLYKEKAELQEVTSKAQYAALQNQLNPHFLFNSLNVLISEIEYNPQNAILFTRNLSDVYRYILQNHNQQLALLADELRFMESYILLHQIRLGNCISVDLNLAPNLYAYKVPPLTLQLLAENVIKHNFVSISKPMTISIGFIANEEMLTVSNNICPKKDIYTSGTGLKNLSDRYKLICNKSIEVIKTDISFTVKVPLLYE
ncbi:Histidine kinase [anaerobic digester metagenome]